MTNTLNVPGQALPPSEVLAEVALWSIEDTSEKKDILNLMVTPDNWREWEQPLKELLNGSPALTLFERFHAEGLKTGWACAARIRAHARRWARRQNQLH